MKLDSLISSIEVELSQAERTRDKAILEVREILSAASQDGRANLTPEEDVRVKECFDIRDRKDKDIDGIRVKLESAQRAKEYDTGVDQLQGERTDTGAKLPAYDRAARVGREERTYRKDVDRTGAGFIRDIAQQFLYRNPEAEFRLTQHMREERVERAQYLQRAVGTGGFTGLVVPQYLTDMYAPATAALRPFADICNKHELPAEGMTVNISRITTSSSVDIQNTAGTPTENVAVSETDMDDTLLTENVQTAAGQQTLSRQAIDRGTGIEGVTMDDLFRRYASKLDSLLINQSTTGLSAVASATTYTDLNPSGAELYPKVLGAVAGVEAALLNFGMATHAVMHSRRWHWLSSQLTSQWPMINQPGIPPQSMGENAAIAYNAGVRGTLPNGLRVVVDNNIQTNFETNNEDEIYIVADNECHLWEDPQAPVFIRAEQPKAATLGVLLVLYGYFAYSFRRYSGGVGKIMGSGLTTPSF